MTRFRAIASAIPQSIQVVAVSKGQSIDSIMKVYQEGCRDFGESRVQEALEKMKTAPDDIAWHFIGSLQKNKVSKVIGKFKLIHSVDSFELAEKISELSLQEKLVTSVLVQVNASGELSKHGLSPNECQEQFTRFLGLSGIHVQGLMTMAPFVENEEAIRQCFRNLRQLRDQLQTVHQHSLPLLSMGMSHDYPIAIEEGATLLRIGTAIFT